MQTILQPNQTMIRQVLFKAHSSFELIAGMIEILKSNPQHAKPHQLSWPLLIIFIGS